MSYRGKTSNYLALGEERRSMIGIWPCIYSMPRLHSANFFFCKPIERHEQLSHVPFFGSPDIS